jgi:hypothetical protein
MFTSSRKEGPPLTFKETPMLEGRILNLASGESGVVSNLEAEAIIAGALGECALVTMRGEVSRKVVAAGVHYQSPEINQGKITEIYRFLQDEYQIKPESISTSIIWGKVIEEENKLAVLRELRGIGISDYQEFQGAQGALDLKSGQILTELTPEIKKQIADHYRWLLNYRKEIIKRLAGKDSDRKKKI